MIKGAFYPAVPAPLRADGSIDQAAQASYVAYMREQAPGGVAVWAHTGRGLMLTPAQREYLLKSWRDGLPSGTVVAGVGGKSDDEAVQMAQEAAAWGADYLMAYAPVRHRGNDEAIISYHRKLAAVGKPLILFFLYEAAGGVTYSLPVLKELFAIPGVAGIKMATLDSVMTFQDVARLVGEVGGKTTLITGEDRFLGYSLMCGAQGALVGMGAACTRLQHDLLRAWQAGDHARFVALNQKVDAFAQATFIAPMEGYIKRMLWALVALGVIPETAAHDPWGPAVSRAELDEVVRVMKAIGEV